MTKQVTTLTEELKANIVKFLEENPIHYSENETIHADTIKTLVLSKDTDDADEIHTSICDNANLEALNDVIYKFDIDKDNFEDYEELENLVNNNFTYSLKNWFQSIKVPIHITMFSNYDGIDRYDIDFDDECYMNDLVNKLGLNRQGFKRYMLDNYNDYSFSGNWKRDDKKDINSPFKMEEFANEILHLCYNANFSFVLNATLWDLFNVESFDNLKVTIPKGTMYGFLDTCGGSGSIFDSKTQNDFDLVLNTNFDKDYNSFFRLDLCSEFKYNYENIYGTYLKDEETLIIKE